MDCRPTFLILLVISVATAAPSDNKSLSSPKEIFVDKHNENDFKNHFTSQEDPGEGTHGILEGLLQGAESATDSLELLIKDVQNHEEKSHRAIEQIRSEAPEDTDSCVHEVFGMPTRSHPVYCTVKYLSPVAIELYEIKGTISPLRETVSTLSTDLTACKQTSSVADAFVCRTQALRDAWENSEYLRARLNRHFSVIRQLTMEIIDCIKNNQPTQMTLLNNVSQCTETKAKAR